MLKLKPIKQKSGVYCGPASLQVVLDYYGISSSQDELAKKAKTTNKSGTSNISMVKTIEKYGFKTFIKENTTTFVDIRKYVVDKKAPVVVDWFSSYEHPANGHYSVVVDINKTHISLYDPQVGKTRKLPLKEFIQLWFDFDGDIALDKLPVKTYFRWMMAVLPK